MKPPIVSQMKARAGSFTDLLCLVPVLVRVTTAQKLGPSPCTSTFSRSEAVDVYVAKPCPSVNTLTYARAVLSRSLQRSRWKMRCMSTHWSFSRCVCSTYSLVFLGMLRGMSCSGGGPASMLVLLKLELRLRILTASDPLLNVSTNVLSSREYLPKRMEDTMSLHGMMDMSILSLYTRTSPLASATNCSVVAAILSTHMGSMLWMAAGMCTE